MYVIFLYMYEIYGYCLPSFVCNCKLGKGPKFAEGLNLLNPHNLYCITGF